MPLTVSFSTTPDTSVIELVGELDASNASDFHEVIAKAATRGSGTVVIRMAQLTYLASAGLRSLVFARQKMDDSVSIRVVGAGEAVARVIREAGLAGSVVVVDE